ncbi:hypothetical protein Z043_119309 [Scleropages formosus]|uniref:KIAA0040 n=1 Tax=Scleropages formosus TaxID=113540 RepID=A0A0P7USU8_SCLFO|nr:uncharacterized protein KIAA0040 homolog [Scleropages formosus]XP_018608657.1 uncharacterized protein KIAA0040 homolog [Scleropages formosus]KPP62502.1 hypothetical protein Z043_119309 [Scleropages formosus]
MTEAIERFFSDLWSIASTKHDQGIYNTVCLVVLLALPLVVLITSLVVCCHCCCCRKGGCSYCCQPNPNTGTGTGSSNTEKKKKKKKAPNDEDLWISVKTEPMTPDRMALTVV